MKRRHYTTQQVIFGSQIRIKFGRIRWKSAFLADNNHLEISLKEKKFQRLTAENEGSNNS